MGKVVNLFGATSATCATKDSMQVKSFRVDLVRPALKVTGLWSMSAEHLIVGTALAESGLDTVKQFNHGPALSFLQIEPATYLDIVKYLNRKSEKKSAILSACYLDVFPQAVCLTWNIRLAILIARMIYWRVPEQLPHSSDIVGLAKYWKNYYNTNKGAGTVEHFVKAWEAHSDYA